MFEQGKNIIGQFVFKPTYNPKEEKEDICLL